MICINFFWYFTASFFLVLRTTTTTNTDYIFVTYSFSTSEITDFQQKCWWSNKLGFYQTVWYSIGRIGMKMIYTTTHKEGGQTCSPTTKDTMSVVIGDNTIASTENHNYCTNNTKQHQHGRQLKKLITIDCWKRILGKPVSIGTIPMEPQQSWKPPQLRISRIGLVLEKNTLPPPLKPLLLIPNLFN